MQGFAMTAQKVILTGVNSLDIIIEKVQQWDYYQKLPESVHGFQLNRTIQQQDSKLLIFEYLCPERHRSLYALYDKATKEFMFHTVTGLFAFCDINSIAADLAEFEQALRKSLTATLESLVCLDKDRLGSVFCRKGIFDKEWPSLLPQQAYGFDLFISPQQPVKIVNGSFIIIDYCDFAAESNLTVYYNIYRDEFFAERRIRRLPEILTDFDANSLDVLIDKLSVRLVPALSDLRGLINITKEN